MVLPEIFANAAVSVKKYENAVKFGNNKGTRVGC